MSWENIGNCGSGRLPNDSAWIEQCHKMAISYLNFVLGAPPEGCELRIMWHRHELGDYPSIGVHWDFPPSCAPSEYISKCELLLKKFDNAIKWYEISPDSVYEVLEMFDEDDDETDDDDE